MMIRNDDLWENTILILPCDACKVRAAYEVVKDDPVYTRDYYNKGHVLLVRCLLCGKVVPAIQSTYRDILRSVVVLLIPLAIGVIMYWETKDDWWLLIGGVLFLVTPGIYNLMGSIMSKRRGA